MLVCDNRIELKLEIHFLLFFAQGKVLIFLIISNNYINKNFHSQCKSYIDPKMEIVFS